METLIEKLRNAAAEDAEVWFAAAGELRAAVEASPEAWKDEIETALDEAIHSNVKVANAYKQAWADVEAADAIFTDAASKFSENDPEAKDAYGTLVRAKAHAWDVYWEAQRLRGITEELHAVSQTIAVLLAEREAKN